MFKKQPLVLAIAINAAVLCLPLVQAAEVNLRTGLGYDTNPFRLSDSFSADEEVYWRNQVDISLGKVSPWFADLRVINNSYDDGRADSTTVSWGLGYEYKFGESKHKAELSLNGRSNDRTYVSRFRGDTFEVGGVQAGDRYDYKRLNPRAEFEFNLRGRNKLLANIEYRDQNYDDFPELAISNLDYSSWIFDLGWQNYLNDKFRYEIEANYRQREHDNRPARNADGTLIEGSNLHYQILGIGLNMRYRFSRQTYLYANLGLGDRSDNGGSYYDTDTFTSSLRLRHKTQAGALWTLGLYYQDLEYGRSQFVTDIENDAEAPSSKGFRGVASYERPLGNFAGGELSWYSSLRFYDFSSDNSIYEYDRITVETGLELAFSP